MSQPEPPPEFLAFLRAMFGVDEIVIVERRDPVGFEPCDDPQCAVCPDVRKRRMAEYNRRVARSSQN